MTPAELVDAQAKDEGLWLPAATVVEACLQQALRKLHAAVEAQAAPSSGNILKDAYAAMIAKKEAAQEPARREKLIEETRQVVRENFRHSREAMAQAAQGPADEWALFEAWAEARYPLAVQNHSIGHYARGLKNEAWNGWQARAALKGTT